MLYHQCCTINAVPSMHIFVNKKINFENCFINIKNIAIFNLIFGNYIFHFVKYVNHETFFIYIIYIKIFNAVILEFF